LADDEVFIVLFVNSIKVNLLVASLKLNLGYYILELQNILIINTQKE
jgi:hypothetical protein